MIVVSINICCLVEFTIIFIIPFRADRPIVMLLRGEQCKYTGVYIMALPG